MKLREFFRRYKIKAKTFWTILIITIAEIGLILWCNNWMPTPAMIPPFIQFILIFENRDVWAKLSEKEKEELTLSEDDVSNFVRGVEQKLKTGITVEEIIAKILS